MITETALEMQYWCGQEFQGVARWEPTFEFGKGRIMNYTRTSEHSMPPSIGELYGLVIHANAESIVSDTSLAPFESAELSRMIDIVRVLQV